MSTNGFNGASHMPIDTSHHPYRHGIHRNGGDERNSISSSDDGNYPPFSEAMKYEADIEDDNAALISQTLNTDGTPKRPMNAFMIFARRRRPQVSAENQAMRTGEISKILSKEWNAMPPSEKQFYQDQARQLKDTFNSKYPDYVYRRRPNHSRRPRRKQDGVDPQNSSSTSDDFGFDDSSESPTETRDLKGMDHFSNLHRAMSTSEPHPDMSKFPFGGSRTDYGYPSPNPPFHPSDSSSKPFGTTSLEIGPSSLPAMSGTGPLGSQSRPSTGYSSDTGSPNSWGLPPMRPSSSSSSWVGGDMNRTYQPVGTPKSVQFGAGWPRPPSSLSTTSTSSYGMPQMMGNDAVHDNTVPPATTATSYPSHGMPSGAFYNSRQYDNQGHNMILSTSPPTHYQNGSFRDSQQYISRNSQELPSISNYSMHSTSHPGTSHIHGLPMPLQFQC